MVAGCRLQVTGCGLPVFKKPWFVQTGNSGKDYRFFALSQRPASHQIRTKFGTASHLLRTKATIARTDANKSEDLPLLVA